MKMHQSHHQPAGQIKTQPLHGVDLSSRNANNQRKSLENLHRLNNEYKWAKFEVILTFGKGKDENLIVVKSSQRDGPCQGGRNSRLDKTEPQKGCQVS